MKNRNLTPVEWGALIGAAVGSLTFLARLISDKSEEANQLEETTREETDGGRVSRVGLTFSVMGYFTGAPEPILDSGAPVIPHFL